MKHGKLIWGNRYITVLGKSEFGGDHYTIDIQMPVYLKKPLQENGTRTFLEYSAEGAVLCQLMKECFPMNHINYSCFVFDNDAQIGIRFTPFVTGHFQMVTKKSEEVGKWLESKYVLYKI